MAKDNTKYVFNNDEFVKGRLVLAVVKQYATVHNASLDDFKSAFPSSLQGSQNVVISSDEIEQKRQNSNDTKTRYFLKDDDPLVTSDGKTVYVSRNGVLKILVVLSKEQRNSVMTLRESYHYRIYGQQRCSQINVLYKQNY